MSEATRSFPTLFVSNSLIWTVIAIPLRTTDFFQHSMLGVLKHKMLKKKKRLLASALHLDPVILDARVTYESLVSL